MAIIDEQFIEQFEDRTLNPRYFNHYGHLQLAWLYLHKYSLEIAIEKMTGGISAYATSLGATEKFQRTLTEAIVRIMAARFHDSMEESLQQYLMENNYRRRRSSICAPDSLQR